MRYAKAVPLLALTLSFFVGCGGEPTEPIGRTHQRVIGGVDSPPERDNIVLLRVPGAQICSAALVAPGLILTARHCVSVFTDGEFTCATDGTVDSDRQRSPFNAGTLGETVPPEDILFFSGQVVAPEQLDYPSATGVRVFALNTDTICRNDIALVQIEPELDLPVFPLRLHEGTFPGDPMLVVGYGQNDTPAYDRSERDVSVLAVGESEYYPAAGRANQRSFTVGQSVCPGDSGGPAITDRGAIAGVFSLINFDCMSTLANNTYTQVAAYASFVEDAFDQAGYEPVLEAPANEGGAAGAPSSDATGGSGGGKNATGGGAGSGGSGGSGGKGSGGSGGGTEPTKKGSSSACYCRAGGRPERGSPWLAVAALLGTAIWRRPDKKRKRHA